MHFLPARRKELAVLLPLAVAEPKLIFPSPLAALHLTALPQAVTTMRGGGRVLLTEMLLPRIARLA